MMNETATFSALRGESNFNITLCTPDTWTRFSSLVMVSGLSVFGTVGNMFMISALMVQENLIDKGNAFVANVALADLLVTAVVLPSASVILLADLHQTSVVCYIQWSLILLCCLVTVFTSFAIAVENYARLCVSREEYKLMTTSRIIVIIIGIWIGAAIFVSADFAMDVGPNFCKRLRLFWYHGLVVAVLVILPLTFTFACYCKTFKKVEEIRSRWTTKPPIVFRWDYSLMKSNLYSFVVLIVFWIPFTAALVVTTFEKVPGNVLCHLAFFAVSKSCVNNLVYCATNVHFREAYSKLFRYCCCKAAIAFNQVTRRSNADTDVRARFHSLGIFNSPYRSVDSRDNLTQAREIRVKI